MFRLRSVVTPMLHQKWNRFATTTTEFPLPPRSPPSSKRFHLEESDITEKFSRGGGPGGQSVNKSRNKVQLVHVPTGLTVSCHEQRDLTTNRSIARKLLKDKIDLLLNGEDSRLGKRAIRVKKKKDKAASRARKKYGGIDQKRQEEDEEDEEEEVEKKT